MIIPVKKEEILALENDPTPSISAEEDLRMILRHNINPEGLDRAPSLMSEDAFKTFVSQDGAALLLVDGHCRSYGTGRTSPLSVWSASFAAALGQSPSLVVLHYFCGLHTNSRRALSGPLGLVKSLIGQLLAHESLGIGTSSSICLEPKSVEGVKNDGIKALCDILRQLLLQLDKSKVVFCIIDNVCEFEKNYWENWLQHLTVIFETLHDLVHLKTSGGHMKLKDLMTSAARSTQLVDKVTSQEHISLDGKSHPSGHSLGRMLPSTSALTSQDIPIAGS